MRWLLLFFVLFIGSMACNKGVDRKLQLVGSRMNLGAIGFGDPNPTQKYTYNELGQLIHIIHSSRGVIAHDDLFDFKYENGRLIEIALNNAAYTRIDYFADGRVKEINVEPTAAIPTYLSRYEFGYKNNNRHFDSCKIFRVEDGVETFYRLLIFEREVNGNILSQSYLRPDHHDQFFEYKEEYVFGNIDNPLYHLGSPLNFGYYYSNKLPIRKVITWKGEEFKTDINYKKNEIEPFVTRISMDVGEYSYFDLK